MNDVDIRELERFMRDEVPDMASFYAACIFGTRARAAAKLKKDPASVSRSISRLETRLGAPLADPKEKKAFVPSDVGEEVKKFVEKTLAASAHLHKNLTRLQRGAEIRVATTSYAWIAYGNELTAAYSKFRPDGVLNPGGSVWQQDRVWEEIEKQVVDGDADIGIYAYPPSRPRAFPGKLAEMNWLQEEFVLVLPMPLARRINRDRVSVRELAELLGTLPKVVHYSRRLNFDRTDVIEDYLRRQRVLNKFDGDWLFGVETLDEAKQMLIKTGGISFLPWPMVAEEHAAKRLKAYPMSPGIRPRTMKVIYREHGCRPAVMDLLRAARSISYKRLFPAESTVRGAHTR